MRAAVEIDDAVGMYVLINDVDGAVVLENLKRRSQIRGARDARVESILFRGSAVARFAKFCFCWAAASGRYGIFAVRRIDNHVRAFQAGVRVVLRHPDATQVRPGFAARRSHLPR